MEALISQYIVAGRKGPGTRLMDDFEITYDFKGTTVTVRRWRR
jgi:hypothetical protein